MSDALPFDPDAFAREYGDEPPGDVERQGALVVTLADVEPRTVEWSWQGRIPRGTVTLVVGDPGLGKSFLGLDLAARVSTGAKWPDGTLAPHGHAIVLTAEDGLADTVVPRLAAMGADRSRVHALTAIREGARERPFSLATDLARLEEAVGRAEWESELALVLIDPLAAYLGDADSHVDADVRAVLGPLAAFAERRRIAVVAVMHLNKATQMRALYRTGGSIAFVAAARAVFAVTTDPEAPDSPRRLFAPLKMNLAPRPLTLAFAVAGAPPRIEWEREPVLGVDVEAALRGPLADDERSGRQEAVDFLRAELADGPRPAAEVQRSARDYGIAPRTLDRAKKELSIISRRQGGTGERGHWEWALPEEDAGRALRTPRGDVGALRHGQAKDAKDATCTSGDVGDVGALRQDGARPGEDGDAINGVCGTPEPDGDGAVARGEGVLKAHTASRAVPVAFIEAVARAHERYGTVNERLGVGVLPTRHTRKSAGEKRQ